MHIRRLTTGDEEAACRLVERVKFAIDDIRDVPLAPSDLAALVGDERAYLLGAYVDGAPVGLAYGYCFPRLDGPRPMMFLYEIGVLEQHRRRGIGRALMEEMKRLAQARHCTKMFVPTEASNEAALALYRAAGGEGGPDPKAATFWWNW
jgi:ribosomal protein S18 acetylase RimI-like enzyme